MPSFNLKSSSSDNEPEDEALSGLPLVGLKTCESSNQLVDASGELSAVNVLSVSLYT